jgi:two-component system cell cycle response regulator
MDFAIKDSLSGLYNRRYFDIHLPNMVKKAIDNNKNLYALMIDIDDFKDINDMYSYKEGDLVIKSIASALTDLLSVTDLVARYGGEEFVVIIYGFDGDITSITERIRKSISIACDNEENLPEELKVTASIGVTKFTKDDNIPELMKTR